MESTVYIAILQFISQPLFNMQQDEQTAHDIFLRNTHSNIFSIKIPSHNASKQNLDLMAHALVLNKLALLPFYENQQFSRLYKLSLECIINSDGERFKRTAFIEEVMAHVVGWQLNMSMFGAWPYTRACFYSIEQKAKESGQVLERVILRRGILQPNKQQFINKSQNMSFRSAELKYLIKLLNKQEEELPDITFELPYDVIYLDDDQCWVRLREEFVNGRLSAEQCQDCLVQYDRASAAVFLKEHIKHDKLQEILVRLKLRSDTFMTILRRQGSNLVKAMRAIQARVNKK